MFISDSRLKIKWYRIVHCSRNPCFLQALLHFFAVVNLQCVLSPSAGIVWINVWGGLNTRFAQPLGVALGDLVAQCHFVIQQSQFGQQYGGLQGVKSAVHAHTNVVVAPVLPVAGNLAHHFRQFLVVCKNGATIAITTQRFAGEEASTGYCRQVAAFAAFVGGTKALGRVFNNWYAVFGCNGVDGIKVGTLPIQADRDDGFGAGGNGGFKQGRVKVVGAGVNVHINGLGAQQGHGFGGGYVGKARGNDFVTRAYAQRHLGNLQCIGTVCHGYAVFGTGVGAQLVFQLGHFRAQDVLAVVKHALNAGVNVGFQPLVLAFEVDEFHGVYSVSLLTTASVS